jgi:hypothetical protein
MARQRSEYPLIRSPCPKAIIFGLLLIIAVVGIDCQFVGFIFGRSIFGGFGPVGAPGWPERRIADGIFRAVKGLSPKGIL